MKNKNILLVSLLAAIILISLGGIYVLNNPSCCSADTANNQQNLSEHLSPTEFKNAISSGKYKLIDVRTLSEFNNGHLKGASQTDFYSTKDFNSYLDSLDKNGKYLIYCHTGNRSGQTLLLMKAKGFTDAHDLSGGINNWIANGYEVVK